jgi:hypothetical protein
LFAARARIFSARHGVSSFRVKLLSSMSVVVSESILGCRNIFSYPGCAPFLSAAAHILVFYVAQPASPCTLCPARFSMPRRPCSSQVQPCVFPDIQVLTNHVLCRQTSVRSLVGCRVPSFMYPPWAARASSLLAAHEALYSPSSPDIALVVVEVKLWTDSTTSNTTHVVVVRIRAVSDSIIISFHVLILHLCHAMARVIIFNLSNSSDTRLVVFRLLVVSLI